MAVNTDAIGKRYPASVYAVGREKIREYAYAVGETNPLYIDVEAAREAGYADVVAPALFDPEVGIDFAHMLHAGQEFEWGGVVVAGDEITTTTTVAEIGERAGMGSYVFRTESLNERGETVCTG